MDYRVEERLPGVYDRYVLSVDVGGSKTNIALVGVKDVLDVIKIYKFQSQKIKPINAINRVLKDLKEREDIEVSEMGMAVPGPVSGCKCELTNLPWTMSCKQVLENTLLKKISLINDFQATGFGIELLDHQNQEYMIQLPHGDYQPKGEKGMKAVMGPGTGLGKTILVEKENGYQPMPSEGGHSEMVVESKKDYELLHFLRTRLSTEVVEWENVVSGPGLVNIYNFLRKDNVDGKIAKEIGEADDYHKPILINKHREDDDCKKALETFVKFFTRCSRNFALDVLPKSGLYLAGGMTPKMLGPIREGFMAEFEKGRFKDLLHEIPVYILTTEDTPLLGAAKVIVDHPELTVSK